MGLLNFSPRAIAHRGASAYAPENTIVAFTKAAQLGMKWVEFDVMQSQDGEVIVFHDETLDRTTNGKGDVDQVAYAHLRALDAGAWFMPQFSGERIPTLMQTLDFLKNTNMNANVELKAIGDRDEALVLGVVRDMKDYLKKYNDRILFSSFSIDALKYMRRYAPNAQLGYLMHEWLPDWQQTCDALNCITMNVFEEILTAERVQEIKQSGRQLLSYTVNDRERAKQLYAWGVDAVFSDCPDKVLC